MIPEPVKRIWFKEWRNWIMWILFRNRARHRLPSSIHITPSSCATPLRKTWVWICTRMTLLLGRSCWELHIFLGRRGDRGDVLAKLSDESIHPWGSERKTQRRYIAGWNLLQLWTQPTTWGSWSEPMVYHQILTESHWQTDCCIHIYIYIYNYTILI